MSDPKPVSALLWWGSLTSFLAVCILIAIFVPRAYRKGCGKTLRWFKRISAEGPFAKAALSAARSTCGRCLVRTAVPPTSLKVRAVSSRSATVVLQHDSGQLLADNSFEIEVPGAYIFFFKAALPPSPFLPTTHTYSRCR